jgi:hypothetical protein
MLKNADSSDTTQKINAVNEGTTLMRRAGIPYENDICVLPSAPIEKHIPTVTAMDLAVYAQTQIVNR